jgi:hypothetical protein
VTYFSNQLICIRNAIFLVLSFHQFLLGSGAHTRNLQELTSFITSLEINQGGICPFVRQVLMGEAVGLAVGKING